MPIKSYACTIILLVLLPIACLSQINSADTIHLDGSVIFFELDSSSSTNFGLIDPYENAKLISSNEIESECYEGRILIQMLVSKKGKPVELKIFKSFDDSANKIALKRARKFRFIPMKHAKTGETLKQRVIIPVVFKKTIPEN